MNHGPAGQQPILFTLLHDFLLSVPFPCSPICLSVFISWKRSNEREVTKDNRGYTSPVSLAVQVLCNTHWTGFVTSGLFKHICVCVCVCVPMYVCVLPILWQSQRLDTFSVLGEELLSWMECSRISFTYLGLRWPDTFFPVYINISLDIFVTNSRNYFLVVHMLHIHIVT